MNAKNNKKKILCIIPARSGSKGIPHKNIKIFNGKPLLAWCISQAQGSKYASQMRIIVSTDSENYAFIARQNGAETPFLRPKEISQDLSTDLECFHHAIDWLKTNENYCPDIVLQLRPTQPCRKVEDIDKCLELFMENYDNYDSLRSVVEYEKSPYKMYTVSDSDDGPPQLNPLYQEVNGIDEPYNQCRQFLPKTYLHQGYIDIFKTELLEQNKISGSRIYPYVMDKSETIDIDSSHDWEKAEQRLNIV